MKVLFLKENTMFCSKILGEISIFNWGVHRDFSSYFERFDVA